MPGSYAAAGRPTARPAVNRLLATLTAGRILLVPILIGTFMVEPAVTTVALVLFMVADLYDGVLARQLQADGWTRRAMDSTVDRLAIDSCLVAAWVAGALPLVLLCGFLARDAYCALVCARLVSQRRVAIKADIVYRGLSFSFAVWATCAPFLTHASRTAFATAIFIASIAVAVDLTRSVRIVLKTSPTISNGVIDAAVLRRQRRSVGLDRPRPSNGARPAVVVTSG